MKNASKFQIFWSISFTNEFNCLSPSTAFNFNNDDVRPDDIRFFGFGFAFAFTDSISATIQDEQEWDKAIFLRKEFLRIQRHQYQTKCFVAPKPFLWCLLSCLPLVARVRTNGMGIIVFLLSFFRYILHTFKHLS